mmetsp:Transcript_9126/g.10583  ORF Transcript_9126/g.10583 Transcript_9126/m.10583 type:complete len:129 (-) Transcript_9126:58-444(-)
MPVLCSSPTAATAEAASPCCDSRCCAASPRGERGLPWGDEVIKKDVIIHNLRQDLSGQQQEVKQQQLQFEQHMQQMQQQHLQQLQQQACQIQELQLLQIQRLQKTAQTEQEAVCLPLEPSFGSSTPAQ